MKKTFLFLKAYKGKAILCALIIALLVVTLLHTSIFFQEYDTTENYYPTNFSNAITRDTPVLVYFTPQYARSDKLLVNFVANSDAAANTPVLFTLYDDADNVLQQTTLLPGQTPTNEMTLIHLEKAPKAGWQYHFSLTCEVEDESESFCLSVGTADKSSIDAWRWGEQQESAEPDIHLTYTRLRTNYFILFSACVLAAILAVFLPPLKNRRLQVVYQCGLMLLVPAMVLYTVELLNLTTVFDMPVKAVICEYLLLFLILLIVYAVSGRFSIALIGGSFLLLAFATINYCVLCFRQTVLLPTDLFGISTALHVAGGYQLYFSRELLLVLAVAVAVLCLALRDKVVLRALPVRVASAVAAAALCVSSWFFAVSPTVYGRMDLSLNVWDQTAQSKNNGYYMNFLLNLPLLHHGAPDGYRAQDIPALLEAALSDETDFHGALASGVQPHIITIMNESLIDLSLFGDPGADADPLPYIHSLSQMEGAYVGTTAVSTYGGGTSCSEFEFLTSFPLALTDPSGAPLAQFVTDETPALASYLSHLGYTSMAFHPAPSTNWSRGSAYPRLGFSSAWFDTEFGAEKTVNGKVSDEDFYAGMIRAFEARNESPQFYFGISIQNHGAYDFPSEPTIHLADVPGKYPEVEQFLSLETLSDQAFEQFLHYFSNVEEPVIVLLFGDHWPALDANFIAGATGAATFDEIDILKRYTTPVVMWSNYDVDFGNVPRQASLNYLAPLLLQAAGLPLSPFYKFALSTMQEYPVVSRVGIVTADGSRLVHDDASTAYPGLQEYAYMVYNGLFDRNDRVEWVFSSA